MTHLDCLNRALSDVKMKYIAARYNNDGDISPEDLDIVLKRLGSFKHDNVTYDLSEGTKSDISSMNDSVASEYADFIHNYIYNYKPEAVNYDPDINPDEEQIGPMAQEIEKVNPACIKETADGTKTVDTGKLALMNAGAIADIARQLKELTAKLEQLGIN